ncbi:hypothetical protein [Cohnella zeiphila]|uniref:Uncharacterized protein n=1 Tax=Cohnella zeiphila TaxID=2761120 RepID=A0A7X0VWV0_9BACL|nr:hypothetical protein [Cohnella zeiphila]MBB6732787.1 hypothetical protein [Cohnella zeiphila]
MRVKEVGVHQRVNAQGGLYVQIEGTGQEIFYGSADRLAIETANERGWNGKGRSTVGVPSKKGIDLYTRSYWFHERL